MKKQFELTDADLQPFDDEQRQAVMGLFKRWEGYAEDRINSAIAEATGEVELVETSDSVKRALLKDKKTLNKMYSLWKSNGVLPGRSDRIEYKDFVEVDRKHTATLRQELADFASTDHPLLIPRVISEVVKEAIEPNIVLTTMLQRINYSHGTHLTFPAMGAFHAADIPEGGEYPERSLDFAGQITAIIGKSGVAVKMTEEMIRYSQYDVMSMHLRAAGRALIRWKEKKVANLILDNAGSTNTLVDNESASYPSTTGRNSQGAYNGALTLDDLMKSYATMINRGFTPNTIIMNPFGWQMFSDEGLQRAFGFQNGAQMWQVLQGAPGAAPQWSNGNFGNGLLQNTTVSSPQNLATTYTQVPSIFPYPFRIVISPYMEYDSSANTIDFVMCDSSELGVLVVDEEVTTDQFTDPSKDIHKVKIRERYAVAAVNEGKGTGLFKGISLAKSFDFARNFQTTIASTGLINELTGDATHVDIIV